MSTLKELMEGDLNPVKKTWSTLSCRIPLKVKAEITRIAASKGMNVNQYVLHCITRVCDGPIIPSHRYEEEYDLLLEENHTAEYECQELTKENKKLKATINEMKKEKALNLSKI